MSIYKKLFEAKKEMEAITKDSKNPYFKSNYFDINKLISEVEPILQKHNLLLIQPIENNKVFSIIIEVDTAEQISSCLDLPTITDPQKLGSAITYYRRYTLQSLLGLQAEDDDGNSASKQTKEERKPSLTLEGFKYLKTSKNKEEIKTALDKRRMTTTQRNELKGML